MNQIKVKYTAFINLSVKAEINRNTEIQKYIIQNAEYRKRIQKYKFPSLCVSEIRVTILKYMFGYLKFFFCFSNSFHVF